jgi:hypothetical protein
MTGQQTALQRKTTIILSLGIVLMIFSLSACSEQTEPYYTPVTFDTIGEYEKGDAIVITARVRWLSECYLVLSQGGRNYCTVMIEPIETENSINAENMFVRAFIFYLDENDEPEDNTMKLVGGVEDENIRFYTNDIEELTSEDSVLFFGAITDIYQVDESTHIDIDVSKIERAN